MRRILFLDFAVRYFNPTRNLLPALMTQVGDTVFSALLHRPADWCVPGISYDARDRARVALEKAGAHFSRGRPLPVAAVLTRLGLRPFSRSWFATQYQEAFREEIRRARYGFTCGSALGISIRKLFETRLEKA